MGARFSSKSSPGFKSIRVVHMDGYVLDFGYPVSARQVLKTGQLPSKKQHLLFTASQLLSTESKPLNPDAQLQTGQLYFLLPCSILLPEVSSADRVFLVKRLISIAKSSKCTTVQAAESRGIGSLSSQNSLAGNSQVRRPWKPVLGTIKEK